MVKTVTASVPLTFKDNFSVNSKGYRNYRPVYPDALFDYFASLGPDRQLAWDCATGTGQSAVALSAHYEMVLATDGSRQQLLNAEHRSGVFYTAGIAENACIKSRCVDLVCVSQALHWFELEKFALEVARVLKSGGVLAVWCYDLFQSTPQLDALVLRLYRDIVGEYWDDARTMVEQGYADVRFPLTAIPTPDFSMQMAWRLDRLLGYLGTWSAVNRFRERTGQDPLDQVRDEIVEAWGDPETNRMLSWPLTLRAWRKERDQ